MDKFNTNVNKLPKNQTPICNNKPTITIPSPNPLSRHQRNMKEVEDTLECDYDVEPTKLYLAIQHKKWELANGLVKANPQQAKTWVYRKGKESSNKKKEHVVKDADEEESVEVVVTPKAQGGTAKVTEVKIRWKLLPLHAAVIFGAPESTIQALLTTFPRGCCMKDDQGMLPIHLAIRNESSPSVITMLLIAFPKSANIGDRKNRTPLHLTQMMKSISLQEKYVNVLQNYNHYYNVATASYDASEMHQAEVNKQYLSEQLDAQKLELIGQVDSLELELAKSKDENKVLMEHLDSAQSQLSSIATDSKNFYTDTISQLDNEVKKMKKENEAKKEHYRCQLDLKLKEIEELKSELNTREGDIELYKQINEEKNKSIEIATERSSASRLSNEYLEDRIKVLEAENLAALNDLTELESQLKKKIQNEQILAAQVSDLASKLSQSAMMCSDLMNTHQTHIQSFHDEKAKMKKSYDSLMSRLQYVLRTMDEMTKEHERILEVSCNQEKIISEMFKQQDKIVSQSSRHEQNYIDAAWEREEIVRILTRQAEESEKFNNERKMLIDVVRENNRCIANTASDRQEVISSISKSRGLMDSFKKEVHELYETVTNEVDGISIDSDKESDDDKDSGSYEENDAGKENDVELNKEKNNVGVNIIKQKETSPESESEGSNDEALTMNVTSENTVDISPTMSTLSSASYDDYNHNDVDVDHNHNDKIDEDEEAFRKECEEEEEEENALAEISMNVKKTISINKVHAMDDMESNVDSLCKEAAALIASTPSKLVDY